MLDKAGLKRSLTLPVIASPMFIVSGPELVIAECLSGVLGAFPSLNARTAEQLDEWLTRIKAAVGDRPYAVNLIVHSSNTRLQTDLELCAAHKVPVVITSLRPPTEVVATVHKYGGLVFHDIINIKHAQKAAGEGVDGLIAVCAGAGGHAGRLNPFALLTEIRQFYDGIVVLAGAISKGEHVLAAEIMGADFTYMGTRFIATKESNATPEYKQCIVDSRGEEIVYTSLFSGVHGNYLARSIRAAGLDPDNLPEADKSKMDFGSGGDTAKKVWKDIWGAGQGVGSIHDIPDVATLVTRLKQEYDAARARICG